MSLPVGCILTLSMTFKDPGRKNTVAPYPALTNFEFRTYFSRPNNISSFTFMVKF